MAPDPFDIVGKVLDDRYRIEYVVGEGGFGIVYRAFHLGFESAIAIKVLKVPHGMKLAERQQFLEAFHQEGKLLFALSKLDTTFVQVLEKGVLQRDGVPIAPYLVMEWLDGKTLDSDLKERRASGIAGRSLAELITLLDPIAGALTVAHTHNKVAHRDVKPENIFLVRSARGGITAKLLDFGIAKVMTSTGLAALNDPTVRASGGLTPQYAAPEQWNRKYGHTGPWSDVYALALVSVELLTGRPALQGDEPAQFFGATIDPERPTPRRHGALVSDAVEAVFQKALAVKPEARYLSMQSFWSALKAAANSRADLPETTVPWKPAPPPAPSASGRSKKIARRGAWLAFAGGTTTALVVVIWASRTPNPQNGNGVNTAENPAARDGGPSATLTGDADLDGAVMDVRPPSPTHLPSTAPAASLSCGVLVRSAQGGAFEDPFAPKQRCADSGYRIITLDELRQIVKRSDFPACIQADRQDLKLPMHVWTDLASDDMPIKVIRKGSVNVGDSSVAWALCVPREEIK